MYLVNQEKNGEKKIQLIIGGTRLIRFVVLNGPGSKFVLAISSIIFESLCHHPPPQVTPAVKLSAELTV